MTTLIYKGSGAKVDDLYHEHIKPVLGGGLIGHSSDGDSHRRKLMHCQAQSDDGEWYRPVDYEDFLYSVAKIPDPDDQQKYDIKGSSREHGGTRPFSNIMAPLTLFNEAPKRKSVAPLALRNAYLWLVWPSLMRGYETIFQYVVFL